MDVKFCGQCGEAVQPANRFCSACGTNLVAIQAVAPLANPSLLRLKAAVESLAKNDASVALAILDQLCADEPGLAIARAYRGIAYLRLTRVADARDELLESVALAPESFICRSKYAEFLARLGFYDQAVEQLDIALVHGAPDSESRLAAIELRQFSREKMKGIYYRHTGYPKLSNILPRSLFNKKSLVTQGEIR